MFRFKVLLVDFDFYSSQFALIFFAFVYERSAVETILILIRFMHLAASRGDSQ